MGLIVDTGVFIRAERRASAQGEPPWDAYGEVFISAITVSELLVGVHRADTAGRRARRLAFVEAVLDSCSVLDFTVEVARVHAELMAALLAEGRMIGAHDLIIAATGVAHGCAVLTTNVAGFERVPGLTVLSPSA